MMRTGSVVAVIGAPLVLGVGPSAAQTTFNGSIAVVTIPCAATYIVSARAHNGNPTCPLSIRTFARTDGRLIFRRAFRQPNTRRRCSQPALRIYSRCIVRTRNSRLCRSCRRGDWRCRGRCRVGLRRCRRLLAARPSWPGRPSRYQAPSGSFVLGIARLRVPEAGRCRFFGHFTGRIGRIAVKAYTQALSEISSPPGDPRTGRFCLLGYATERNGEPAAGFWGNVTREQVCLRSRGLRFPPGRVPERTPERQPTARPDPQPRWQRDQPRDWRPQLPWPRPRRPAPTPQFPNQQKR
jgi:hypothetical protein